MKLTVVVFLVGCCSKFSQYVTEFFNYCSMHDLLPVV